MNQITLIGRLTRDAKVMQGNSTAVLFTLAVNNGRDREGNEMTSFIPCRLIGKAASSKVVNYLTKGKQVCFTGRLDVYNSTKEKMSNGYPVVMFNVTGFNLELLGSQSDSQPGEYAPNGTGRSSMKTVDAGYPGQVSPMDEEDIQF